jgi:hypothetical protein
LSHALRLVAHAGATGGLPNRPSASARRPEVPHGRS